MALTDIGGGTTTEFQQLLARINNDVAQTPTSGGNLINGPRSLASSLSSSNAQVSLQVNTDTRVRLSTLDPTIYQNSPILSILASTNGMLFPYTPTLTFTQGVDYMNLQLVHSNTDYQAYTRTPSVKISISGKFTVQNQREGQYSLAVIHFLRTVSKSYFGQIDAKAGKAGLPPPVLLLTGYGSFMFGQTSSTGGLKVILTNHSWTFDENIDTIPISVSGGSVGGTVRLPAMFTIQCDLTVIQTPARMRNVFSFNDFASGKLMASNDGWI